VTLTAQAPSWYRASTVFVAVDTLDTAARRPPRRPSSRS